ncbi:MAG TPA: NfeD family protein [Sphingomonas sp.]|nr:NfeD family protein [Sphingomonas sp.]
MTPGLIWLIAALTLGGAELIAPGVFLVFLAFAAAVVGVFLLLFPDLPLWAQFLAFTAWSVIAVLIGRRWYADNRPESTDPLLNDRVARLLGEVVTVTKAIDGGRGRVRVGDGEWIASGPDAPAGTRVRVMGVRDTALIVEPLPLQELAP